MAVTTKLALDEAGQIGYLNFSREEWSRLRAFTPLPLNESDLVTLRGINEQLSLEEVSDIYLPLSRLLNLYVSAVQAMNKATDTFLGHLPAKIPYVIGIAGSVAVGKSTIARVLQALLSRWPDHPKVDLITTDGFLLPTRILEKRGLMNRKGFPESYDRAALLRFLAQIKRGQPEVTAPVYSHLIYDILDGETKLVTQPDILIVEGLNVLQTGTPRKSNQQTQLFGGDLQLFVSDFFDFSIFIDAEEKLIESWYVSRFLKLRETVFTNPESYFNRYAALSHPEAVDKAKSIWRDINGPNLRENIMPTRERARLVLRKGPDHRVEQVRLRTM